MSKLFLLAAAAAAVCVVAPSGVLAQESNFARDRNISVRERSRPDFDAVGVHLGGFTAYPKLAAAIESNDNVYARVKAAEQDDIFYTIAPEVRLRSNWSRHALGAYATGLVSRYNDLKSEDIETWTAGANGRLDVDRTSNFNFSADYGDLNEARTAPDTPGTVVKPIVYSSASAKVAGAKEFNRLKLGGGLGVNKLNYDDGVTATGVVVDQDNRDRTTTIASVRADYAISPAAALLAEAVFNKRNYRLAPPAATLQRDSDGFELLVGANFDLSNTARGELRVGYTSQDYKAFEDQSGLALHGQVEWFATQLTTVTGSASRTPEEGTANGSPGYFSSTVGVRVDHELLRNVLLYGQVGYQKDKYKSIDRDDGRTSAGFGATYFMNRTIGVRAGYTYLKQNSSGVVAGPDYSVNRFNLSLVFQR
jgi:hypothetical protein